MKKIFSIFLTVIFLASAMGVTINSHFCGNTLESVSLVVQDCCCGEGNENSCCKNEITYLKITDQYSPASQLHVEKVDIAADAGCFAFPSAFSVRSPSDCPLTSYVAPCAASPPPKFPDKIISFRSLLI